MKTAENLTITTPGEREIVMSRVFDAPRALVFDAFTKPELLARWYGPREWSLFICEIELQVGGAFRFVSRRPDGREIGQRGVYREIVRPERLVHTEAWEDWNPGESLVTVDLVEERTKTRMTNTMRFPTKEVRDTLLQSGITSGSGEAFDKLAALLAAPKRDLVVRRVYSAPVAAVWKAWTEADDVKRWWGPNGFTAPVAKMDVREGGTSLVCMRSPTGQDMYSTWAYQKVVPLERLEYVFNLADAEGMRLDPAKLGLPSEFPRDVRHLVTFAAMGDETELTVTEYDYTSDHMFDMSKAGLEQCLDKMAAVLATR